MRFGLVLMGVAFTGFAFAEEKPAPANVAANVNGELIRLDEVDALLKRRPSADTPLTASQLRELRHAILNDLIDDALLSQYLRQHGPKIDGAEVEKRMKLLSAALQRQGKTLADYCRDVGKTEDQIRDAWAATVQFQKYVDKLATDEALKKYHEAYREFFDRAWVSASHIVIRISPTAAPGERKAAREKLEGIRPIIVSGKMTFADAAKKYSIDPTATSGGFIGKIARKDTIVEESFAKAAFALKVGDVSEPVDTDYGVHLIQISERHAGTPTPFEKVSEEVRDCFADDIRQNLIRQLRKSVPIQVTLPE